MSIYSVLSGFYPNFEKTSAARKAHGRQVKLLFGADKPLG